MVKTAYILLGAFVYGLLGCHNTNLGPDRSAPLNSAQLNLVRNINFAVGTTTTAARLAYPALELAAGSPPETPSEKLQKMITLLKAGQCDSASVPPAEKYDQSWSSSWSVGGRNCPLTINEASEFHPEIRQWKISRAITVNSADFHKESGLDSVSLQGSLEDGPMFGKQHSVRGSFKYDKLFVDGVLPVWVTIAVHPLSANSGDISLQMNTGDIYASVRVQWQGKNQVITLNGREIDEATYTDLFSSFQLLELLDRIQKMM